MANYAISYGRNCHTAADAPCGRPRRARLRHKPASADGDHVNSLARGGAALVAFAVVAVLVALGALARVDRAVLDIVHCHTRRGSTSERRSSPRLGNPKSSAAS